jgi:tetratricopeptide (TPR) repeat protein
MQAHQPAPGDQAGAPTADPSAIASSLRARAGELYAAGCLDESRLLFRRLADGLDPVESHHGLGVLALRRADPDRALDHFHAALLLAPRHANSLYWLGYLAEQDALLFEAFLLYHAALASEPRHRRAREAAARLTAAGAEALRTDAPPGGGAAPPLGHDAAGGRLGPHGPGALDRLAEAPSGDSQDEPSIGRGTRGLVVELTPFQQQAWNTGRFKQGFNFRLQVPDGGLVEVEIRGQKIYGRLRNGDNVEVLSGIRRRGLLSASRLYNHTSHSEVRRRFI